MKDIFRSKELKGFDEEIARLTETLKNTDPTSENYVKIVDNLKVLCEAREKKNPLQLNADTLIAVGANVIGLLLVLNFEKTGVVTSKAFGMLFKGKS